MSTEHEVRVVRLGNIRKHEGADTLGITEVDGRPCIVRLADWSPGDVAIYVPIDSLVPVDDPRFAFLAPRAGPDGFARIRAMRLRGVFSMGLLVPPIDDGVEEDITYLEGQDVRERLGIRVYEPPIPTGGGETERDPGFLPVYDIESARKWAMVVLAEGEEVVLTEKTHGCLMANTRIAMADGTQRAISTLTAGDEVLGVIDGRVTATRVTRKFANGHSDRWLKVTGKRRRAGRGSNFFAITCTPEHMFWRPDLAQFVAAGALAAGNTVTMLRSEMGLTPIQEQVLLGKLLGDGSYSTNGITSLVSWGHCAEDTEYVEWTARALGDLAASAREKQTSGYGTAMVRSRTVSSPYIRDMFESFRSQAGKCVPAWVADRLTPIALAFWYMDDGSLEDAGNGSEAKARFAVCGFTESDCAVLVRALARLGIGAVLYGDSGRLRLRLNTDDAERLFLLAAPYVPLAMQRKLPERYRGHAGWLPANERQYKPMLVEQTILAVEPFSAQKFTIRHDIETETHNYFAHGVLVHNSNARFAFHRGRFWAASRTQFYKPGEGMWRRVADAERLEEKLSTVPGVAIYGEVYGQVQDLRYGKNGANLVVFDALEIGTRRWLDYDEYRDLTERLGLLRVPELYRGPWSPALAALAEGDSVLAGMNGAKHVREGWVLKPVKERVHEALGRVILKHHGEGYLTRKGG
jgi:hypothetical protein